MQDDHALPQATSQINRNEFLYIFLYIFVTSITLVSKSGEYSEDQSLMQDRDILWWKEVNILSWELNVMGDRT